MKIKRNIAFKLRVYGKDSNLFQIRIRTTYNGQRLDLKTGCQINDREAWNEAEQLVNDWYVGPKGETAQAINNELRNVKDQMDFQKEQAAQSQVDNVEAAVNEQVDAAKQKANDEVNNAKQKANDEVNKAAQKANEEINKAAGDALKSLGL